MFFVIICWVFDYIDIEGESKRVCGGYVKIMIYAIIILSLFLAYILFVPIRINLNCHIDNKLSTVSTIAFFPLKFNISGGAAKKQKPAKITKPKKEKGKRFNSARLTYPDIRLLFSLLQETLRLLGRFIAKPRYRFRADFVGGTEEPDITGQIFGAYMALKPNLPDGVYISYQPDFLIGRFRGDVECGLAVRLARLIYEFMIFIFRVPKVKTIKLYRKLGGKNGK